ncbi:MAG: hypothetical protein CL942_08770 [Desulfovibrio sp.]|nr:hypothetical protein [Desulfovibrio sp.]|tara:strand:+ start:5313 stop:6113 length:801 start_codon:yes stop_codon:yes gene_type:complete
MKLSLYENAQSYLAESLKKAVAAKENDHEWKFAISNLVQAVELFFKERLRREHEWLIFSDVDKRTKTVSIQKAAHRLNALCQLNIEYAESGKRKPASDLLLAVKCRNDIIHGSISIESEQKYLFSRILNYISNFCELQFKLSVKDLCTKDVWEIIISDYKHTLVQYETALKIIKENNYSELTDCPICGFTTFVADEGINTCFTCQHKEYAFYCEICDEITLESDLSMSRADEFEACNECWHDLERAQEEEDYLMDQQYYSHLNDKD